MGFFTKILTFAAIMYFIKPDDKSLHDQISYQITGGGVAGKILSKAIDYASIIEIKDLGVFKIAQVMLPNEQEYIYVGVAQMWFPCRIHS